MNNVKKTKLNLLVSVIYQIVAIALGLIIPRITMVSYGSSVNGLLSSALQFVGYLSLLESGIQAVAQKALYKTVGSNDLLSTNAVLAAVNKNYQKIGCYYLVGLLILSTVYPYIIHDNNLDFWTIFFVVFFSGLSNVVLFFFQGKYRILLQAEGKQYFISLMNIITNIANHCVKIVLLCLKVNIAAVVFGSFVVSLIPSAITMAYIKKRYKWINLSVSPCFSELSQSNDAIVHTVSWMVVNNIDTIILTIFCDLRVVSVYVVYKMINNYMLSFAKIPYESFSFRLGQLYNHDKDRFTNYIDCAELFTGAICFVLFTVTLCLTKDFVSLYTNDVNDIVYADTTLAILFVVVELLNYMRTPMLNTINYAGHFRQTIPAAIIEMVIKIVASIIGAVYLGIYGVLLGSVASYLYRTIEVIIYSNRRLLGRSPKRTFTYYFLHWMILIGIYSVYIAMDIEIDNYFTFAVTGGLLTVVTCAIYFVAIILLFKGEWHYIKDSVIRR